MGNVGGAHANFHGRSMEYQNATEPFEEAEELKLSKSGVIPSDINWTL